MAGETDDPRAPELSAAHAVLAKVAFDHAMLMTTGPEAGDSSTDAAAIAPSATKYIVLVKFGSVGVIKVDVQFFIGEGAVLHYEGVGAGSIVGGGSYWGSAWLNYDPDTVRGWRAVFEANVFNLVANINLVGMKGEFIGTIAAGGPGIGGGVAAGVGAFG